ncbi:MAG: hypothetical protein H7224_10095 [Polaromonas sp.]|nr:hypothetical protein [Polaromonas sp.]
MNTNFSYHVQFSEHNETPEAEREEVMNTLSDSLQGLLAVNDPGATVTDSASQKGEGHKIIELTTALDDEQVGAALKVFSKQHGLSISALE